MVKDNYIDCGTIVYSSAFTTTKIHIYCHISFTSKFTFINDVNLAVAWQISLIHPTLF